MDNWYKKVLIGDTVKQTNKPQYEKQGTKTESFYIRNLLRNSLHLQREKSGENVQEKKCFQFCNSLDMFILTLNV